MVQPDVHTKIHNHALPGEAVIIQVMPLLVVLRVVLKESSGIKTIK
jgi:hypothetical protein